MKNKSKRINHIAIAVPNVEKAAKNWEKALGVKKSKVSILNEHGVKVIFLKFSNLKIELIEPIDNNSPIYKFLERNPNGGMHHICFEVNDLQKSINYLNEHQIGILGDKKPRNGAHDKPVIFLHPKDISGTLVELEEV